MNHEIQLLMAKILYHTFKSKINPETVAR